MLNTTTRLKLFIMSFFDLASNVSTTKLVYGNTRFIGFSRMPSALKTLQFYFSKRLSGEINREILRDASSLSEYLHNNVSFSNTDYWQTCIDHDGPVLLVTPHYGPFAVGCLKACLDFNGIRHVNTFYDPPEKNQSTVTYKDVLSALGYNFTPIFNDRKGLISAIKALRNNEALTMMPDVFEISSQTIYVPFFDHLTCAMTGTAFLARKSSALIAHAYVRHVNFGNIMIDIEKPYLMPVSENAELDIYNQTSVFIASLEKQLRRHPEHWMYLPNLPSRLTSAFSKNSHEIEGKIHSLSIALNLHQGKKI